VSPGGATYRTPSFQGPDARRRPRSWGPPDVETDAGMVVRVAAGEAGHEQLVAWINRRTH
jgi:hypothetical protein